MPESIQKALLRKAAGPEHLLCHIENVRGGFGKLRDLGNYIGSQSGKKISQNTAAALAGYVGSLWEQVQARQDVCPST